MNEFVNYPSYLWPLFQYLKQPFYMKNFPFKNETYEIIGVCMEIQRTLGFGFSEVIYFIRTQWKWSLLPVT